ncbi:hypothetical protein RHECNPAF_1360048 [Rhizobium etli CNPAF512]|nr:hypothetical protein RHECNPAF_1360048 [Rhizobium etli CNPAF512]
MTACHLCPIYCTYELYTGRGDLMPIFPPRKRDEKNFRLQ